MSAATKKRKTESTDLAMQEDRSLVETAKYLTSLLTIHESLNEYINALGTTDKSGYGLLYSQYSGDGYSLNSNVVHESLRKFTVVRNAKGCVEAIHDSKTKIVGLKLHQIMVMTYALNNGIKELIITENDDDDALEVTFLPTGLNVEDVPTPREEAKKKPVVMVHHYKGKTLVFFTIADMKKLLSINYIEHSSMKKVLQMFNILKEADSEYKLIPKNVGTLDQLQALMSASDVRPLSNFYGSLVSANVSNSSISEKIAAFVKVPSKAFARTLGLCKPYSQQVFERGSLSKAEKVKLLELDEDEMVLMSNIPIDDKFYESLISSPEEYPVFEASANIGLLKNKKWQPMSGATTYKAGDLLAMLQAIVTSNGGKSAQGTTKESDTNDLEDLEEADF